MADDNTKYGWPAADQRSLIGKRISRVDGPEKVSGRAKYTYDVHRPGMLYGKVVRSPHAHAKVVSVDTSAAEKMPGVKGVYIIQDKGSEIHWAGDDIVVVAAVDEPTAADAARAIKVEYQPLPFFVDDFSEPKNVAASTGPLTQRDVFQMLNDDAPDDQVVAAVQKRGLAFKVTPELAKRMKDNEVSDEVIKALEAAPVKEPQPTNSPYKKETEQIKGDPDAGFKEAEVVSEGVYGCPVITHCCLESHGSIAEWTDDDHLFSHISTQNVSGLAGQYAQALKIPESNVHVHQDHIGGGFGSKFGIDRWGAYTAQVSKKAGQGESGCQERWHAHGVAIRLMGHRRPRRRRRSAHALCGKHSQPAQAAYGCRHKYRTGASVASAQSSAGLPHYHVRY
jgi:xanthine dehydrogenase YagR molybdenum-binding subunit